MDLFLQPAPKNFQDEKIWVDWINERMVALRNVQNRLNGNVVINESEQSYRYRALKSLATSKMLTEPQRQPHTTKQKQQGLLKNV